MNFIKMKTFCATKDTFKKMKRQEWKKRIVNYLARVKCLEFVKNFSSATKRHTSPLKKGKGLA